MHRFFEWLGSTPWSVALLESFWVWPGRMLPWTRGAFAAMVITGVLLFYSNPDRSPEINVDWTAQVMVTSVNYGQP